MSTPERRNSEAKPTVRIAGPAAGAGAGHGAVSHPRSFKLRFAPRRVPGQSYFSAIRPLALPTLVTDKWWSRRAAADAAAAAAEERALRRVEDMFARGPKQKHDRPQLSSHEYGWWIEHAPPLDRGDRRLNHHLRDSAWMKSRLRVLAADAGAAPRRR